MLGNLFFLHHHGLLLDVVEFATPVPHQNQLLHLDAAFLVVVFVLRAHEVHALAEELTQLDLVLRFPFLILLFHAIELPRQLVDLHGIILGRDVVSIRLRGHRGDGVKSKEGDEADEHGDGAPIKPTDDCRHRRGRNTLAKSVPLEDYVPLFWGDESVSTARSDVANGRLYQELAIVWRETAKGIYSRAHASHGGHVKKAEAQASQQDKVKLGANTADLAELADAGAEDPQPLAAHGRTCLPEVLASLREVRIRSADVVVLLFLLALFSVLLPFRTLSRLCIYLRNFIVVFFGRGPAHRQSDD
mmetsp:Transcript_30339/g.76721  ORF Transcript_30339/g.76721 Transcript_30339/m.76721 type:complete len:303 (+) Transcript_30339:770-1678(+)